MIREALRSGAIVYSTAATTVSPHWPPLLRRAGIDFVFIDSEHTALSRETLAWLCRAYAACQIPAVIRIPSPDPHAAAQVLDGGATGFIAPYLETIPQMQELRAVARYRPLKGQRAARAASDPSHLETQLRSYLHDRNQDTIWIANIESVPAIEQLDELLAAADLDAVLIGPHDLSCSLGIPEQYAHPRFDSAVRQIFACARRHGVGAGIHFWSDLAREIDWARSAGANLIMHSVDTVLYGEALQRDFAQLRSALGGPGPEGGDASGGVSIV
jgi:4-hydroxy-2-oxoheptanedioate aldolase